MVLFGNFILNIGREGLILSVYNGIVGEVGFFFFGCYVDFVMKFG